MSISSLKTGVVSPSSLLAGNPANIPTSLVDYLVVAGGGGAGTSSDGTAAAGGGGGGGYLTATNFSVSAGSSYASD